MTAGKSRYAGLGAVLKKKEQPKAEGPAEKPKPAKVTLYVRPDQVDAVEDIKHAERKRGRKVSLSDLYTEALDLLIEKYKGKG